MLANAGSVAFFLLLASFPGLAVMSLYGRFADAGVISHDVKLPAEFPPADVMDPVTGEIIDLARADATTLRNASIMSPLAAVYGANSGMSALCDVLNTVYGVKESRSLLTFYATTLCLTLFSLLTMVASIAAAAILSSVFHCAGLDRSFRPFLSVVMWPVLFCLILGSLAVLYRFGPAYRSARWKWIGWGSAGASTLWIVGSMFFCPYVPVFGSYNRIYGSLGAGACFMVWLWMSTVVVLTGAKFDAGLERGRPAGPASDAARSDTAGGDGSRGAGS